MPSKFEALKAARTGGGKSRLQSYKASNDDIYDEVTEQDYRQIVGNRLARDDFIEDDDGTGMYVDNGVDDDIGRRKGRNSEDESEEEEEYEARGSKKSNASRAKAKPRPQKAAPQAPSAYRPQVSAAQEADFLSGLLSTIEQSDVGVDLDSEQPPLRPAIRKRKSSPIYETEDRRHHHDRDRDDVFAPSSESMMDGDVATSDSFAVGEDGDDNNATGVWEMRDRKRSRTKTRVAGPSVKFEAEEDEDDEGMDVDERSAQPTEVVVKVEDEEEEAEEEEEELETRSAGTRQGLGTRPISSVKSRLLAMRSKSSSSTINGQEGSSAAANSATTTTTTTASRPRATVNATSLSAKALAAQRREADEAAARVKAESLASEVKPSSSSSSSNLAAVKQEAAAKARESWLAIQERLNAANSTGPTEEEPLGSPFTEQAARSKTYVPLVRIDAFERDAQGETSHKDAYGDQVSTLRMYWLDYSEQDGNVHLMGKAFDRNSGRYVSVCVTVSGIQRNLFVLPRPRRVEEDGHETDVDVTAVDVHQELDQVRRKHNIQGRFAIKPVKRSYAFELVDVPKGESEWYKCVYGFDQPQLPSDIKGETFSHVFGTNTSPFETLVVKRKIMGPCWIEIKDCVQLDAKDKPASWARLEVRVTDPKNVNPIPESEAASAMPPLTVLSLATRTIVNHKQNTQEILAITASVWDGYNIEDPTPVEKLYHTPHTFVRPLGDRFPPGFENKARTQRNMTVLRDERSLLNSTLSLIQRTDPDIIVGHEFFGSVVEVLLQRMKTLNVDHWSRIGRMRRKALTIGKRWYNNAKFFSGRLVADLSGDGAKGMIDSVSWSLTEMFQTQLGITREEIDPDDTAGYFDGYAVGPDRLLHFIRHLQMDAFGQMAISSKVQFLPLTKQLTNLAGNSWNRTLTGARAERNEYILLHEFHRLKYICPDKGAGKAPARARKGGKQEDAEDGNAEGGGGSGGAKKNTFQGGLVFHPKKGLWETHILVMDFNSLYPSIIQEFNIDFTTVDRDDSVEVIEDAIPTAPGPDVSQGVLPRLIATLVNRRKQVKGLMKDKSAGAIKMLQWDIKQKALKLTANSMYGCLGFEGSRFYARPLAALTTFKGREILTRTKEMAESLGLDVVYGDTDSVFVNSNKTDYQEAIKIANEFKRHVNEQYKLLEIDLDAVFARVLLLQKKKYAALKVADDGKSAKLEIKGLDMVRREFCKLSKDASRYVLDHIMSGKPTEEVVNEIHDYLTLLGNNVREKRVDLDDLVIFKRLGKNPEEYPDKASQPHVQVALRMKAKGASAKAGDVIPYIFCKGDNNKGHKADNAWHPDDLRRAGSTLEVDDTYYLGTQILTSVQRLCDEIEGTDKARLAECLGLDPQQYQQAVASTSTGDDYSTLASQISDKERFRLSEPLRLKCRACKTDLLYASLLDDFEKNKLIQVNGIICTCGHPFSPASVLVQVENAIRAHISRYYQCTLVCTECNERTRSMSVYGRRCVSKPGCRGEMQLEYTDAMLYNQLLYYRSIFDSSKALESAKSLSGSRAEELQAIALRNQPLYQEILSMLEAYLDKCGRRYVDLGGLFSFMNKLVL